MIYWIWLSRIAGIGQVTQQILLNHFTEPADIYRAALNELLSCPGLRRDKAERIILSRSLEEAKRILDKTFRLNIQLLARNNPMYPDKAKLVPDMPVLLYYKGLLIKNSMGVAIVGSRRCTEYGKRVVIEAASFLAHNGISVISGMAKGIDSYAHTVSLHEGGYTIAFLANGLDICYPSEHKCLMEQIIERGAAISEYPPGTQPDRCLFPKRNRLISAWSEKVLVVEAGEKSGALITADFSRKYGREVLSVPDNIFSRESSGSNKLVLDGARIYIHESQLLPEGSYVKKRTNDQRRRRRIQNRENEEAEKVTELEKLVLNSLEASENKKIQELSVELNLEQIKLLEIVSEMELKGLIRVSPNGYLTLN